MVKQWIPLSQRQTVTPQQLPLVQHPLKASHSYPTKRHLANSEVNSLIDQLKNYKQNKVSDPQNIKDLPQELLHWLLHTTQEAPKIILASNIGLHPARPINDMEPYYDALKKYGYPNLYKVLTPQDFSDSRHTLDRSSREMFRDYFSFKSRPDYENLITEMVNRLNEVLLLEGESYIGSGNGENNHYNIFAIKEHLAIYGDFINLCNNIGVTFKAGR